MSDADEDYDINAEQYDDAAMYDDAGDYAGDSAGEPMDMDDMNAPPPAPAPVALVAPAAAARQSDLGATAASSSSSRAGGRAAGANTRNASAAAPAAPAAAPSGRGRGRGRGRGAAAAAAPAATAPSAAKTRRAGAFIKVEDELESSAASSVASIADLAQDTGRAVRDAIMADDEDDDQYGSANERRVPDADNDDNDDDQYLDDDPDDPIVQEIDVYLANDISESLYMLQFPTRPMPFTPDVLPKVGRIKYKTKKVQLDVLLDPTGDHYDRDQGERFGNGLDNRPLLTAFDVRDGLNNNGPRQKLDAIKLESRIVPLNAQYMVGYLKAGEDALHLRPLSTVLQLRPSLDYIDKISEKEKTASQRIMYEERKEAEGVEEEAKAIQVIVRGADDKDAARKASLAELQRAMDNEPWTQLSVFGPEDENSEYFRSLLGETEAEPIQFTSTSASYLDTISPVLTDDAPSVEASLIGSRAEAMRRPVAKMGMSLAAMNKLPVVERIKAFLVNAHVVQFGPMYEAIGQGIPEAEFIQALKEVAFLIRGVWVGRSDLLYTGRPYDARRYLLMLFLEHEYVQRSVFAETSHMPPIMALNMLGEIADFHSGLGWQFKVPADEDFVAKHPALVAQQAAAVRADGEGAMQAMKPLDRIKNRRQSQASREAAAAAAAAAAGSKANRLDGAVIDTKASAAAQTTELLKRLFTFDSVYSKDYLVKSILSHKRREKSLSRDISEATIMASVAANCEQINDVFVLKLTGDAKQDEFRPIVIELFKKQAAVKKVDLMEQFTKVLGKQPASTLYTKLMQDIAIAERGSGNWTLKPSPAPPSES